jgi:hypothetical protein
LTSGSTRANIFDVLAITNTSYSDTIMPNCIAECNRLAEMPISSVLFSLSGLVFPAGQRVFGFLAHLIADTVHVIARFA